MNKKLSLLILSTYLTTTIAPISAFAETNEENVVLYQENQDNQDNQEVKATNPGETSTGITINKDYILLSYVDASGKTLKESKNYLDIFNSLAEISPNCEWVKIVPEHVDNHKATSVTINGVDYDSVGEIYFPFVNTELDESYVIEWHYDKVEPISANESTTTLYHKTFFENLGDTLEYFSIEDLDVSLNQLNFGVNGKNLETAGKKLTEEFLKIEVNTKKNSQFKDSEWFNKLESKYEIYSDANFELKSNADTTKIGESIKVSYYLNIPDVSEKEKQEIIKNLTNGSPLHLYILNEDEKTVKSVSDLKFNKDANKENYFVFEGIAKLSFNERYIISRLPMPDNTVLVDKDDTTTDKDTTDKDTTDKDTTDKDTTDKDTTISKEIVNDNGKYSVSYGYLKDIKNEGLFITKGDSKQLGLWLKKDNIDKLLESKKEDFVLNIDVNSSDLEKSKASSSLTGLSKSFYNKYGKEIIKWISYKSNLEAKPFSVDNTLDINLSDGEYKYDDVVYLYTASNLKDGKIELVGETKVTKDNYDSDNKILKIQFDTKLDLTDRTYFLTKSKVELTSSGLLPDTSGIPQGAFAIAGLTLAAAGGYLILGKRKKDNNK